MLEWGVAGNKITNDVPVLKNRSRNNIKFVKFKLIVKNTADT